jgi:hypothetical protein
VLVLNRCYAMIVLYCSLILEVDTQKSKLISVLQQHGMVIFLVLKHWRFGLVLGLE